MNPEPSWRQRLTAGLDALPSNPAAPGSRFASFRRLYRWFNLTLVQQGGWPLLILLAGAPLTRPGVAPWPWLAAGIAAPALAAALAFVYVRQLPASPGMGSSVSDRASAFQQQARVLLFGLTIALMLARLLLAPELATLGFPVFGIADVLAFQVIHFGVVARSFAAADQGQAAAVLLFGLSWAFRELFLAGVGVGSADLGLSFAGGLAVGLGIGLVSRAVRRWPGGFWAAAAGHFLIIYLVVGFIG